MPVTTSTDGVLHAGELAVQRRLGVQARVAQWAPHMIRNFMPDQHRLFYSQQPFMIVAARDGCGRPWATLLEGPPGFVASPDARRLRLRGRLPEGDALHGHLTPGARIGLLGIELATRRRNRVNGTVVAHADAAFDVAVGQSFGNCPQYITPRTWRRTAAATNPTARPFDRFDDDLLGRIRRADTWFIASGHPGDGGSRAHGLDASHRGGPPGFVQALDERTLILPDYSGNNLFNTIGNLLMDPRAGLLLVDFERGDAMQLTGRTTIVWDVDAPHRYPGAHRLIRFELDAGVLLEDAMRLRWHRPAHERRQVRLTRRVRESVDITSFWLSAANGAPLPAFEAGQHLPISLRIPGARAPLARTYSISSAPGTGQYRLSVKRISGGRASTFLHDQLEVGQTFEVGAPNGDFVLPPGRRPLLLLAAGAGVTPFVSMVHALADAPRPTRLVYSVKDAAHHAFKDELAALARRSPWLTVVPVYTRAEGRLTPARLQPFVQTTDMDCLVCGPAPFMSAMTEALEGLGVRRIWQESF